MSNDDDIYQAITIDEDEFRLPDDCPLPEDFEGYPLEFRMGYMCAFMIFALAQYAPRVDDQVADNVEVFFMPPDGTIH